MQNDFFRPRLFLPVLLSTSRWARGVLQLRTTALTATPLTVPFRVTVSLPVGFGRIVSEREAPSLVANLV